jgi:hypothetical protein
MGIVLRRKFGRNIVILQIRRVRHRQEVESRLRLELREKICRLAGDMHDTRDFACSHLFQCDRVIDEDLLRINVKAKASTSKASTSKALGISVSKETSLSVRPASSTITNASGILSAPVLIASANNSYKDQMRAVPPIGLKFARLRSLIFRLIQRPGTPAVDRKCGIGGRRSGRIAIAVTRSCAPTATNDGSWPDASRPGR